MPETSFTRLRARPYPRQPTPELQQALAAHAIDATRLWEQDIGRAVLTRDEADNRLLQFSVPDCVEGIWGLRALIEALTGAGASVYAYNDPGTEYPAAAESHRPGPEPVRVQWADGQPALDQDTLLAAARNDPQDQAPLEKLTDAQVGAAAKRLFGAFADAP
jgi:hypothetical protein